jgi:hypothetical protein
LIQPHDHRRLRRIDVEQPALAAHVYKPLP